MSELIVEKVRLKNQYISKKIEAEAIKKVLASTYHTAYRIYLIVNGIKELQEFANIVSDEYTLTAYVKTECGFVGEAKDQIWAITHLQPLLRKNPKYILRCELRHNMTNNVIYKCVLEHKHQMTVYNQIQECINNLKEII
jgi:hypothetical protein